MKKYRIPSMRHIKLMSVMVAMVIGTSLLTGCANMMHRLGYMPIQQQPPSKVCTTAPVLITNLKEDVHQRQYQLPDGHTCSEAHDYEQAQLQKSE